MNENETIAVKSEKILNKILKSLYEIDVDAVKLKFEGYNYEKPQFIQINFGIISEDIVSLGTTFLREKYLKRIVEMFSDEIVDKNINKQKLFNVENTMRTFGLNKQNTEFNKYGNICITPSGFIRESGKESIILIMYISYSKN